MFEWLLYSKAGITYLYAQIFLYILLFLIDSFKFYIIINAQNFEVNDLLFMTNPTKTVVLQEYLLWSEWQQKGKIGERKGKTKIKNVKALTGAS